MKTRIIPVIVTVVLAASAAQARPNDDDGDRAQQRGERPHMAASQPPQHSQQPPPPPPQQAPPQPEPQQQAGPAQPHPRDHANAQPRGWIPGDPNHPSATRGNPYAGNQGSQGAQPPVAPVPAARGPGFQGSGQPSGDRSWRGNRPQNPNGQADRSSAPNWNRAQAANQQRWRDSQGHDWRSNRGWYDRYRVDHFRFDSGRYYARQRYSVGLYAYPRGYSTRLWIAGESLPPAFYFDSRYDLTNYWSYDLYEPPLGCRWTRVGNDALLIDEGSGEVLDVVYDLFW